MARTVPGWERLRPSIGESGAPGWRLLSHDGKSQQAAIYRKNEGPWKDASIYIEWRGRDERWEAFLKDAQGRIVGPVYGPHFDPMIRVLDEAVVDRGLPPVL